MGKEIRQCAFLQSIYWIGGRSVFGMIDGSSILGSLGNGIDVMILVTCSNLSILLMFAVSINLFFLVLN